MSNYRTESTERHIGRISLYFKAERGLNIPQLYQYLRKAAEEDILHAFVLAFHIRDCRGGKGERILGRRVLQWLFINYTKEFMSVVEYLPEYGRWDDLLQLWPRVLNLQHVITSPDKAQVKAWLTHLNKNYCSTIKNRERISYLQKCQVEIVRMMGQKLVNDRKGMKKGLPVSLCAKWAPTERSAMDQEYDVVETLCEIMLWSKTKYRKKFLSPLRSHLRVTETLMCKGEWDKIDFNDVPFCAMKRLRNAFERHTPQQLYKWRDSLCMGVRKINLSQLFPHEILHEVGIGDDHNPIYQLQWKTLVDQVGVSGVFEDCSVVIDNSVSMKDWNKEDKDKHIFTPLDVSMGLGLLIASGAKGFFHNSILTFSHDPKLLTVDSTDPYTSYNILREASWAGKINLSSALQILLKKAKAHNVIPKDFPKKLFIFSDMSIEEAIKGKLATKALKKEYSLCGYEIPQIIFWNVRGESSKEFPISHDPNIVLLSGFSLCVINALIKGVEINHWEITKRIIEDERYALIRKAIRK